MKVLICSEDRKISMPIPAGPGAIRLLVRLLSRFGNGKARELLSGIPDEMLDTLFQELKKAKKQHGSWILLEMETVSGDRITVSL